LHIPDTVIGPLTYIPLYIIMIFIWAYAGYRLKKTLRSKQVPMLALLAAFAFIIQMFNLPVVVGTSGHATGGAIMGIILGPWAAVIAMTVTLIIQALLFGDGGLTTLGANSFNIAFVIPFSAYIIYRIMGGRSPVTSKRRLVAAIVAGYLSLTLAAALAGFEFGIQPIMYPASLGYTYIQYPLSYTLPIMVGSHLILFSMIEALATGLIFTYLQVNNPLVLEGKGAGAFKGKTVMGATPKGGVLTDKALRNLLIILGILIVLTPIGLYLGGETFGEDATSTLWNAPLADYGFPGVSTTIGTALGYIASAAVGVAVSGSVLYLLGLLLSKGEEKKVVVAAHDVYTAPQAPVDGSVSIPVWLKVSDTGPRPDHAAPKKSKNYIKKTLSGILNFFEDSVESESYTRRNGLLQGLDPRAKLISILALILGISMAMDWRVLVAVYLLILAFAGMSRIEVGFFIKRVWLFIPIFAGIIALPMIFNIFYPGDSLLTLATPGPDAWLGPLRLPETISITSRGIEAAIVFTLRVATCVSATVLLILTTPREKLFKSLRSVGVPRVYVLTLDMCYRYIFMFTDMVRAFYTAKKSRTIRGLSLVEEQKWVGGRIGYTMVKSMDMGEKVHGAMVSRGYNGDVKVLEDFRMRPRDYVAAASVLAFSALLILISQHIILI
jgi:cobalt/nickel transport system permease protein